MESIKKIRSGGLRFFLMNKIKKHGVRVTATAVQSAMHLSRTGSFDLRTMTALMKPMRRRVYERFKESVSGFLERHHRRPGI